MHQISFAAFAQRPVCPPPPASANGSVLSLPAPAEPGVGVDTSLFSVAGRQLYERYIVLLGDKRLRTDPPTWDDCVPAYQRVWEGLAFSVAGARLLSVVPS